MLRDVTIRINPDGKSWSASLGRFKAEGATPTDAAAALSELLASDIKQAATKEEARLIEAFDPKKIRCVDIYCGTPIYRLSVNAFKIGQLPLAYGTDLYLTEMPLSSGASGLVCVATPSSFPFEVTDVPHAAFDEVRAEVESKFEDATK